MDREKTPLLTEPKAPPSSAPLRRCLVAVSAIVLLVVALVSWKTSYSPVAPSSERLCSTTKDEAGYIRLANGVDNHYFYWFFEAQHEPETAIWLTDGPGGSSLIGLLKENGPCRVVPENLTTEVNAYAWNQKANMIWLDQPTGVGFSYGADDDTVYNSTRVGENVYWFLQGFLDKHPEFEGREVFLTGECYSGHYIPAVAQYIYQQNQLKATDRKHINLQGVAIGNGWTEPLTQIEHAIDIVYDNDYNLTLLTSTQTEQLQRNIDECLVSLPAACLPTPAANRTLCEQVDSACYKKIFASVETHGNRNRFDFRQICQDGVEKYGFCGGIPEVEAFLNQPHVRTYLHVDDTLVGKWTPKSNVVHSAFTGFGDDAASTAPLVAELLDAGLRVLIYVGDADFVFNYQGNLAWLNALAWHGHDGFKSAVEKPFLSRDPLQVQGKALLINAGAVRAHENLVFLKVSNAGHMVATHQPAVALDFINRFFSDASFVL
jgi:carboxypeptidase C (cathepsin A)